MVFSRDEWQGYPLIDTLQAGADDSEELRSVVLDYLVHDDNAGFPPSSIENHSSWLSKEDLAAALYRRLEQCNGWDDFEEQLELDLKHPILKPPEVLLQRALADLTGTPDKGDADEDAGVSAARKLKLVALYFSRRQWYRG